LWLLRAGSQTVVQSCLASIGALPAVPDLRDAVLCSVPPAAQSISPMQRISMTGSRTYRSLVTPLVALSSRVPSGFGWLPSLASLAAPSVHHSYLMAHWCTFITLHETPRTTALVLANIVS
jgi:hypothetical protein